MFFAKIILSAKAVFLSILYKIGDDKRKFCVGAGRLHLPDPTWISRTIVFANGLRSLSADCHGAQHIIPGRSTSGDGETVAHKASDRGGRSGKTLHIDGLNVLTTVASYLTGIPVFMAMDGVVRDAAQRRGSLHQVQYELPVQLFSKALSNLPQEMAVVYLDKKAAISKKIAKWLMAKEAKNVKVLLVDDADDALMKLTYGAIATSDRLVITDAGADIFDLASYILHQNFDLKILDLNDLISIAG